MPRWLDWLFPRRLKVVVDGRGYRVNGEWCASQVEVRQRLEGLGLANDEIVRILRNLNRQKYGDPNR